MPYSAPTDQSDDLPHVMSLTGPLLRARHARRRDDAVAAWILEFERHLSRRLITSWRPHDLGDVVDSEIVRVLERIEFVMVHWTPGRYAAVRASGGRATIDHARREAAQRGEGARHERQVANLDAPIHDIGSTTIADTLTDGHEPSTSVADRDLLRRALLGIRADDRHLVGLVHLGGLTVTEAADALGIARETASRRLGRALTTLATLAGPAVDPTPPPVDPPARRTVSRGWLHSV